MRKTMLGFNCVVLAGAFLLTACGNPEKAAEKAVDKARADWSSALDILDPQTRVKSYDAVIKDVEAIGKKYAKTPFGQAIAAGRPVSDVSIASMKASRDALAARAECFANPTADCLRPFASSSFRDNASYEGSPEAAFANAQALVCDKGFSAADKSLENFKINKPAYAQQLVQLALAASRCNKPGEVKAAIDAYKNAEPAQGPARASAYMSVLATDELRPGWAPLIGELEANLQSGALDGNTAANVALTLAVRYAALGDAKAAIAKYAYFTDTLGYQADWQSKLSLASELIIAGEGEAGLNVVRNNNMKSFEVIALHEAAAELGRQIGVLPTNSGAPFPILYNVKSIGDYMTPVASADKARFTAAAAAIESEMDKLAPVVAVQDSAIGGSGLDCAYGILALVHQKLGDPAKSSAALGKGVALRQSLLAPGAQTVGLEYFAQYEYLALLAQGKIDEAATASEALNNRNDSTRLILKSLAATGDAEKALTFASQLGQGDNRSAYGVIIEGLIGAGKLDKAEQVINAYPGGGAEKAGLQWQLVNKAANDGDPKRAEQAAEKFGLLTGPGARMQLLAVSLNSEKVSGDRKKAEPIIRELFAVGEELDQAGGGANDYQRTERYLAQDAARIAFYNGYLDLGVELYKAASRKDQRPLFAAFSDKAKPKDLTPIFMLAQDNLQGEQLSYVIDAGIRKLEKK